MALAPSTISTGALAVRARLALSGTTGAFDLDVDVEIPVGQFVVLAGPSGAGKTTMLRIVAGLSQPADAYVAMNDTLWCDTARDFQLPVRKRSLGFVFQDHALFPNMSALENVAFALPELPRRERYARSRDLLEMAGLCGLANARPATLSGGQKQRLALMRALARRPALLLLDEPFSALDSQTRSELQSNLRALHERFGATTIMVSHSLSDAKRLADRVISMNAGKLLP